MRLRILGGIAALLLSAVPALAGPGTPTGGGVNAGFTSSIPAGTNTIGNTVPVPNTSGGLTMTRTQVANNTTSVAIKASAGQLYYIRAFSDPTAATGVYIKLYNAAQGSTTCGSGTPVAQYFVPFSSAGAGVVFADDMGEPFSTAITACFTTGFTDADTTAPAANKFVVNFGYK